MRLALVTTGAQNRERLCRLSRSRIGRPMARLAPGPVRVMDRLRIAVHGGHGVAGEQHRGQSGRQRSVTPYMETINDNHRPSLSLTHVDDVSPAAPPPQEGVS
jgi:hypothetical protein